MFAVRDHYNKMLRLAHRRWECIKYNKQISCCWGADRTALFGIALVHADDGYSRRGNFGGSVVRSTGLINSRDGTNVYGARCGEPEGIARSV